MPESSHSTTAALSESVFHILPRATWELAQFQGNYQPQSLFQEGFIHFSKADQVQFVANTYYRGQPDLILLEINPNRLAAELRWEPPAPPRGVSSSTAVEHEQGQLFPHLYGPLNLDAVTAIHPLPVTDTGEFKPDILCSLV